MTLRTWLFWLFLIFLFESQDKKLPCNHVRYHANIYILQFFYPIDVTLDPPVMPLFKQVFCYNKLLMSICYTDISVQKHQKHVSQINIACQQ